MTKRRARPRRDGTGFTVIELMVVVAIVAILSALVVPAVLGRIREEREASRISQQAPRAELLGDGRAPAMERADVAITLTARAVLDGFDVISRYEARFEGRFVVRNRDRDADRIAIAVPFPPGLTEARDVAMSLERDGAAIPEPDDVRYDTSGITWTMALPPGDAVTIAVSYTGVGRDALRYDVAGDGRTGEVHVAIDVRGADAAVPVDALEPTSRDGELRWDYEGLVASRPIVVELSPGAAPLGRAIELLRLAGVAVLVFGVGFWYLSALDRRGRLDRFRWGHFLLLAIDYMLWFALAATMIARGVAPGLAAAAASVVALPLLAVHVARMVDRRFALTRALPLAIATLAGVLASVLAHRERGAVVAIALVVAATGLTLTYRTFVARGEDERARRTAAAETAATERRSAAAAARARRPDQAPCCAACGAAGAATPFCAACGTARPVRLPCARCGVAVHLVSHLLVPGWERRALHCTTCGDRVAA